MSQLGSNHVFKPVVSETKSTLTKDQLAGLQQEYEESAKAKSTVAPSSKAGTKSVFSQLSKPVSKISKATTLQRIDEEDPTNQ